MKTTMAYAKASVPSTEGSSEHLTVISLEDAHALEQRAEQDSVLYDPEDHD